MKHIRILKNLTLSCLFVMSVLLGGVTAVAAPVLTQIAAGQFGNPKVVVSHDAARNINILEAGDPKQKASADQQDESAMPRATIRQDFLVNDITVYPLISCVEDQTMYKLSNVFRRQHRWTDNQPRFQTMYLTPNQTVDFYADIMAGINTASIQNGKTYEFVGWALDMEVRVQAQTPRYLKWKPSKGCMEGTAERIVNVPYQDATITIHELFKVYAEDLDIYKSWRIDGGWYFLYPSGSLGSLGIGGGFAINSSN